MDVGIGLPNSVLGIRGPELVDWARRAEDAGFSSLGTIGRIVYDTHEELIALAAAAGATSRIGLMTTVLVGPPRQPVLLAKQAATLSAISGGRFRLGIGLGPRDDDWAALETPMDHTAGRLEHTVAVCRNIWAGEAPKGAERSVGPQPIDLPIVLGGFSEPAFRRAGRLADGYIAGPMPPDQVAAAYATVRRAAADAGRPTPKRYAARYVALGDDAQAEADRNAASYYAFGGPDMVAGVQGALLRTPAAVREALAQLRDAGADEVVLWPDAAGLEQVDRIAEAALAA
jgi:alkanesulfonate monooxygenase SsuD/methylene tetrahydromethanopterin reductase-like flavin-dependent oxidoreductase (luciferase family)